MPHTTCAHCDVTITNHGQMVTQGGETYCCHNCAVASAGRITGSANMDTCSHCQTPMFDTSTKVERNGEIYCCSNCAQAAMTGAGHH